MYTHPYEHTHTQCVHEYSAVGSKIFIGFKHNLKDYVVYKGIFFVFRFSKNKKFFRFE